MNKYLISMTLFLLFSCASEKPSGKTEAEVLYKEAMSLVKEERYLLATEKLNNLKNQYPYSYYATPAELLQAEILFHQESFVESAAAFLLFRDFHPKHPKISYVVFKIAESYYKQLPDTFDRDLDSAVEAAKYYSEILSKYPNSPYAKDSKNKIKKARGMLKDKEKYIADFYFKTEVFDAARWRYKDILSNFEDKKLRSHSMQRVILSTYFLKEYKKCISLATDYSEFLVEADKKIVKEYSTYCKKKL
ncbi:MAG: outer membrane protein assembly factor BamD [Bacteriovoracaceae bacterium]|jgi:outer membrane protein assembly factor BamD